MNNKSINNTTTTYLLWAGWLIGLNGLHRIYNGKFATGLLWLFTWGLLGMGQFVDLLLIPTMVEEHNNKVRKNLGVSPTGVPLAPTAAVTMTVPNVKVNQEQLLMMQLLKAADAKGGRLSVTQGVMATGAGFAEVEHCLRSMVKTGYVSVVNDINTGVVVYEFNELIS